jgi:hypothetical protein
MQLHPIVYMKMTPHLNRSSLLRPWRRYKTAGGGHLTRVFQQFLYPLKGHTGIFPLTDRQELFKVPV